MKQVWKVVLMFLMIGFASSAFADDIDENPYVVLYRKRLEIAKTIVASKTKTAEYAYTKWRRYADLAEIGAVSRKEASDLGAVYHMAEKEVSIARLKQNSADAFVRIAITRVQAGLSMEVCPVVN